MTTTDETLPARQAAAREVVLSPRAQEILAKLNRLLPEPTNDSVPERSTSSPATCR